MATLLPIMRDRSGNGEDGTYGFENGTAGQNLVPGLVAGDLCIESTQFALGEVTPSYDWFAGSFSFLYWYLVPSTVVFDAVMTAQGFGGIGGNIIQIDSEFGNSTEGGRMNRNYDTTHTDSFIIFPAPAADGLAHFFVWTYDATSGDGKCYIDGVAAPIVTNDPVAPHPMTGTTDHIFFNGGTASFPHTYDEIAVFTSTLSAGDAAALYSAALTDYATWKSTLLGLSPAAWYPLDDHAGGWIVGAVGMS